MTKNFAAIVGFLSCLLVGCGLNRSTPTALPVSSATASSILIEETKVNSYLVRVWRDTSYHLDTVTIEKDGQAEFKSSPWSRYKLIDLTNDEQPEIIVWQYGGGNHGTFQVQGFETDTDLTKILDIPPSMCEGEFKDLDGDGIPEFRTCDHSFVYYNSRCSYATSPFVNVIFQYQPKEGYKLANLNFPRVYEEAIAVHTKRIQEFQIEPAWTQEILREETQCNILPLMLDYLYSGQTDKAWQVLDNYYQFDDVVDFRKDIENRIHESPFFVSQ